MANEIAVRQLSTIAAELEAEGASLAQVLAAANLPPINIEDLFARIDWSTYVGVFDLLAERWGLEKLEQLGAENLYAKESLSFREGLLLEHDSAEVLLQDVCGPGGANAFMFPCMQFELVSIGGRTWTMTVTMRPGYKLSKPHHHYGMGTLRQLPTILFEKSAHVTLKTFEASVRYQIKLPRANPWASFRRRAYRSRPKPIFMQIMRETFSQLAARQTLLQEESLRRLEAESKLAHAEKMEALGNLTGGIAHDFNNLLSVVVGQLDMLQMDLKDEDMRHRVNDALAAAQRGAALTQQLLAFGRQALLHPVAVDANHAIQSISDVLAVTVGETITVNVKSPPEPCGILVDHNQLENALLNIAINARDAMPDGGSLDIEVNVERLDETGLKQRGLDLEPDDYVVISITDHGTGISDDVISHAFEPFFTTKETDKGTGLGLSMVWGFLQQSNGSALIESKIDEGTTVSMYLPKVNVQVGAAEDTAEQERFEPLPEGLKTLVVEDQKVVRNVVSDMLTSLGATVTVVEDGQSALSVLSSDRFDLLITDIVLPGGMLGPDIVTHARSEHPDLKVAFMSGHVQAPRQAEFKHVSSENLLYKPFTLNTLRGLVARVMQD